MSTDTVEHQPQTAAEKAGKVVGEILAPWVVLVLLSLAVPWRATGYSVGFTLLWGFVIAFFCAAVPMAFIVRGAKKGAWDGHHVRNREGRVKPLIVCFASTAVGLAIMLFGHAPTDLVYMAVAMLVSLVVTFVITFRWKISLHAAVSGGGVATLAVVYGPVALALLLVVALICWARVVTGDHTPAQVAAGTALGFGITILTFVPTF
ncbi:phosphatase PAP2 family protein [Amycolatopsis kentuckyensis]|uniref:phosphatase PAP2 family protein n=1 Tax=Amycolatopsis kentuckyensis TaxID=218823 RepID=UPI00356A7A22